MALTPSAQAGIPNPNALAIQWVFPRSRVTYVRARATLGRNDSCSVVLRGQEVSRSHCVLSPGANSLSVEDLGSRNGTFVNGRRVVKAQMLRGAVLRVGDWIGLVRPGAELTPGKLEFSEVAAGLHGSGTLRSVVEAARTVAHRSSALFVEGETGTGKTLVAHAAHHFSERTGRFVVMNCAAVPGALTEAELFGASPSAGADTARIRAGRLRAAHGGTLVLEDLPCLALSVQLKLLEAFRQEPAACSDSEPTHVGVRVIVTAHEPLERAVEDGQLHPELRAWLGDSKLCVPSLRDRVEDIAPLFLQFVREHSAQGSPDIEPRLIERLCLYDWPYNVQELRTLAQGLLSICGTRKALTGSILPERIATHEVSREIGGPAQPSRGAAPDHRSALGSGTLQIGHDPQADERALTLLVDALQFCQHDLGRACSMVGISRTEANRLLELSTILRTPLDKGQHRQR